MSTINVFALDLPIKKGLIKSLTIIYFILIPNISLDPDILLETVFLTAFTKLSNKYNDNAANMKSYDLSYFKKLSEEYEKFICIGGLSKALISLLYLSIISMKLCILVMGIIFEDSPIILILALFCVYKPPFITANSTECTL